MTMRWYQPPSSGYRRATGDEPPPVQSRIRIEALGSAYQLAQQGIRSEGEEAVNLYTHGEILTGLTTGDYVGRTATVVTPGETYQTQVTQIVISAENEYLLDVADDDDDPGAHYADDPSASAPTYNEPAADIPYTDPVSSDPYNEPIDAPIIYDDPLPPDVSPVTGDVYVADVPADDPVYDDPVAYDPNSGAVAPPGWTPEESDPWTY